MSRTKLLIAALAAVAWGCGDRGLKSEDTSGPGQIGGAGEAPGQAVPLVRDPASGVELGGLATLGGRGAKPTSRDAGPAATPAQRSELRAALDEALADGRLEEGIATADVLMVIDPGDAEVLELRGRALARQGDADGSARDLARCCELGRAACCGGGPR